MATTSPTQTKTARKRVPAAERRDALIEAAVHEFAQGGFHGTPVERIARRVGVAQPYVFSLFSSKRELFLAAVERGFDRVCDLMTTAATDFDPATAPPDHDVYKAMGHAYLEMLVTDRDELMLQLQAYAACEDEVVRARVRSCFARLVQHIEQLTGADTERLDEFVRYGMGCNVAAAMGVEDLSAGSEWVQEQGPGDEALEGGTPEGEGRSLGGEPAEGEGQRPEGGPSGG